MRVSSFYSSPSLRLSINTRYDPKLTLSHSQITAKSSRCTNTIMCWFKAACFRTEPFYHHHPTALSHLTEPLYYSFILPYISLPDTSSLPSQSNRTPTPAPVHDFILQYVTNQQIFPPKNFKYSLYRKLIKKYQKTINFLILFHINIFHSNSNQT